MALHELATNAVKYGALGQAGGRLTVKWALRPATDQAAARLTIDWRECGVTAPPPTPEVRGGGQGRELIERALPYQLRAKTTYRLTADGVHCTIERPSPPRASMDPSVPAKRGAQAPRPVRRRTRHGPTSWARAARRALVVRGGPPVGMALDGGRKAASTAGPAYLGELSIRTRRPEGPVIARLRRAGARFASPHEKPVKSPSQRRSPCPALTPSAPAARRSPASARPCSRRRRAAGRRRGGGRRPPPGPRAAGRPRPGRGRARASTRPATGSGRRGGRSCRRCGR